MFFQSFIFERIIKRMKILTFIFTVLSVWGNFVMQAQDPTISADVTQGCDSLKVQFDFATVLGTVTTYNWKFGDGDSSNLDKPFHNYKQPGVYTVTLTLNGTNTNSNVNYIQVGRTPSRDSLNLNISYHDTAMGVPYTYVIGVQYNNNHPLPYSYQWYIDGVAASTGDKFMRTFDTLGIYNGRLVMTDAAGCAATFNESIVVTNEFPVPNVFTPNGDGINDDFIVSSGNAVILVLRIYTRTGLLILKSEGSKIIWDGRLPSGDKVSPGIYYYTIESSGIKPNFKKKGFFYIYQ